MGHKLLNGKPKQIQSVRTIHNEYVTSPRRVEADRRLHAMPKLLSSNGAPDANYLLAAQRMMGNQFVQQELAKSESVHQEGYVQRARGRQIGAAPSPGVEAEPSTPSQQKQENANQPVLDEFKGQNVNKVGHVSSSAGEYEIARTRGVNIRSKPNGALPPIAKVIYDTELQVQCLDSTGAFYFVIAGTGAVGWINRKFVALDPPDLGSHLHHITEANLTTILKNEYVDTNLWTLSTGNDYTTLAAAVVTANKGREGVSVDWEQAQQYRDNNTLKRVLDPWMIDNFAIYHGSKIVRGTNIWLPSPTYIRMLQKSGAIGSRPGWVNTAVEIGKGLAGFVAGVVSGIFGSLWDTLTGLWELGKSIVDAVRSVLDGSLFASIETIYDQVTNLTWADVEKLVNAIITMGKNAFDDFKKKWEHPDSYKQWHFKGYTIGAIALEVVLAIFTGGAALGEKVLAKIGEYFPGLMKVLNRLLSLADELPFRRNKAHAAQHGHGHHGPGQHSRGEHMPGEHGRGEHGHSEHASSEHGEGKHKDRDQDNEMSHDDRAWEQARVMAAIIAEENDTVDTPVLALISILNATVAGRFKVVSRYEAIPLRTPHTYKIIQRSRNKTVDEHYTDGAEKKATSVGGQNRRRWAITKEGTERTVYHRDFKNIYKSKSDGLWWSKDITGHGNSVWKVFEERGDGLHWMADADEYGNFIVGKHKGPTGKYIPWKELTTVNR